MDHWLGPCGKFNFLAVLLNRKPTWLRTACGLSEAGWWHIPDPAAVPLASRRLPGQAGESSRRSRVAVGQPLGWGSQQAGARTLRTCKSFAVEGMHTAPGCLGHICVLF